MWRLTVSVTLLLLSVNQIVYIQRLRHTRKAVSAIMDLLVQKWTMEMQINQAQIDGLIDQTIERIRRDSDDVD